MDEIGTTTATVRGYKFEIAVTADGTFSAHFNGERYESDSLAGLTKALETGIVSSRFRVPFVSERGRDGVMRGYHAGRRELLVEWDNGEKGSIATYTYVFRNPDAVRDARLREIYDELERLDQERNSLQRGRERATEIYSEAIAPLVGEEVVIR